MSRAARAARVLLAPFVLVLLAGGCIGGSSSSGSRSPEQVTLVIATQSPSYQLDLAEGYAPVSEPLFLATNDGLVGYRRTGGAAGNQLVPDLATTIPSPADRGLTWRFQLRSGIRYSTGQLVVASDVRRAIERDFLVGSPGLYAVRDIKGASACASGSACPLKAGIETDDAAGTVTFHLTRPDPELPFTLALPMTYPLPPGTPDTPAVVTPLAATGPYRVAVLKPGSEMVLVRNPQFHQWSAAAQPAGYPDRIVFRLGLSQSHVFAMVSKGDAALAWSFQAPTSSQLAALRRAAIVTRVQRAWTAYLFLDTRLPPFDHAAARSAVSLAIDRAAVVRATGLPNITPSCQIIPPGFPGYVHRCLSAPDMAAARRLVAASGTRGVRVGVMAERGTRDRSAIYIVHLLDALGYRASLRLVAPHAAYSTFSDSRNRVQVGVAGWIADFPSPSNFFIPLLSCSAFVPGSTANSNISQFCDPAIDAAVRRAEAAGGTDPAAAAAQWSAIDRRVTEAAPLVPLYNPYALGVVSRAASRVIWNPQWFVLFDLMHPR